MTAAAAAEFSIHRTELTLLLEVMSPVSATKQTEMVNNPVFLLDYYKLCSCRDLTEKTVHAVFSLLLL
ncbi:Hypothetical predicted protein [Xyrichtys novacula]|uniref:Uncharacterized protein n=1 Tax=Xyrichtys novacula TaxID=13765 RepID=A0AAV1FCX8_XYRNO|nr:Hypothetical predicted protein [Xyrichtys novacula]